MIGVWFSFGPDGPALVESVAAFRAAGGERVAIFDDSKSPVPETVIAKIRPDLRETTCWARGGNLRGWPAVFGVLDSLIAAGEALGGGSAVKIDSDTIVRSLDWINPAAPISGFMAGGSAYLYGMAYHLRIASAKVIRSSMEGRFIAPAVTVNEDTAITSEAMWNFGRECHVHTWDKGLAGGWDYGRTPSGKYARCQVVTFGNRGDIRGCACNNDRRERVALEMARFRANHTMSPGVTPYCAR